MRMKITCPNSPDHKKFSASALVVELWEVDDGGNFLDVIETIDTERAPDSESEYICRECYAECKAAWVEEDDE